MTPRILIIRGGAIGDFILTLPAINLLREAFPHAHLEILGYKHIIALAEERFYAHATRSIEYGPMAGFFIPDAKLAPDLIEYFGSFQQIVSYLFDPDGIFEDNMRRCGVKNFIPVSPKLDDSGHAASQLAQPLQDLALFLEDPAATIYPSAADREFAASFFAGLESRIIAIHPGSGSETKNWPVKNWRALGDWLFSLQPRACDPARGRGGGPGHHGGPLQPRGRTTRSILRRTCLSRISRPCWSAAGCLSGTTAASRISPPLPARNASSCSARRIPRCGLPLTSR